MRVMICKKLSELAGTAFAAALILGSLALPNAARAGSGGPPPPPVECSAATVIFVAGLCGAAANPGSPNTFAFTFNGGDAGGTAYIPLLDPNAIVSGSFKIDGSSATPDIITGADVTADWGIPALPSGKTAFETPVELIAIDLPGALTFVDVAFDSTDPIVNGPILVDNGLENFFYDPGLPGAPPPVGVPEPGSLALLGSALTAIGLYRQRRKRS